MQKPFWLDYLGAIIFLTHLNKKTQKAHKTLLISSTCNLEDNSFENERHYI